MNLCEQRLHRYLHLALKMHNAKRVILRGSRHVARLLYRLGDHIAFHLQLGFQFVNNTRPLQSFS